MQFSYTVRLSQLRRMLAARVRGHCSTHGGDVQPAVGSVVTWTWSVEVAGPESAQVWGVMEYEQRCWMLSGKECSWITCTRAGSDDEEGRSVQGEGGEPAVCRGAVRGEFVPLCSGECPAPRLVILDRPRGQPLPVSATGGWGDAGGGGPEVVVIQA